MKTYQEFISEAKKCWPGYKKKGTQKLFGKTYNRCVKEGKVPYPRNEEIEYELEESSSNKDKLLNAIARKVHNSPNRKERQKWKDIETKHRTRFIPPEKKLWRKGITQSDREWSNQQDYENLDTFGTKSTMDPGSGVRHITKNPKKLRKQRALGEIL